MYGKKGEDTFLKLKTLLGNVEARDFYVDLDELNNLASRRFSPSLKIKKIKSKLYVYGTVRYLTVAYLLAFSRMFSMDFSIRNLNLVLLILFGVFIFYYLNLFFN